MFRENKQNDKKKTFQDKFVLVCCVCAVASTSEEYDFAYVLVFENHTKWEKILPTIDKQTRNLHRLHLSLFS